MSYTLDEVGGQVVMKALSRNTSLCSMRCKARVVLEALFENRIGNLQGNVQSSSTTQRLRITGGFRNALYTYHHLAGCLAYRLVEPCGRQLYSWSFGSLRNFVHFPNGHRPQCRLENIR